MNSVNFLILACALALAAAAGDARPASPAAPGAPPTAVQPSGERPAPREAASLAPVPAKASFPYTAIVKLYVTFPNKHKSEGSGALVDRFHVLTAGHMIYSAKDGGWASEVKVIPEMRGDSRPLGTARVTHSRTYEKWLRWSKDHGGTSTGAYDIALLTLDQALGDQTGWMAFGYDNNDAAFRRGRVLSTAGYPAGDGYDGLLMYGASGPTRGLTGDRRGITYARPSIRFHGGQSGSPLWSLDAARQSRTIYAVFSGGGGGSSFATRITQEIFEDLESWRRSDPLPRPGASGVAPPETEALPNRPRGARPGKAADTSHEGRPVKSAARPQAGATGPVP
jgi:V8-like Glu-specific endopeptidase